MDETRVIIKEGIANTLARAYHIAAALCVCVCVCVCMHTHTHRPSLYTHAQTVCRGESMCKITNESLCEITNQHRVRPDSD